MAWRKVDADMAHSNRKQAWWDHCTAAERQFWREQAQSPHIADALAAYQYALNPQSACPTTPSDTPCPICQHLMERLALPGGRVEFCPSCGYRALECRDTPQK